MANGFMWYAGENAIITRGPYKGREVALVRPVGHDDKILVNTLDAPEASDNHAFLVSETALEMLEGGDYEGQ